MTMTRRFVIDTNVLISALLFKIISSITVFN